MNTRMCPLEGQTALVTGGVYGIGYAIAKTLRHSGAKTVCNCNACTSTNIGIANCKQS